MSSLHDWQLTEERKKGMRQFFIGSGSDWPRWRLSVPAWKWAICTHRNHLPWVDAIWSNGDHATQSNRPRCPRKLHRGSSWRVSTLENQKSHMRIDNFLLFWYSESVFGRFLKKKKKKICVLLFPLVICTCSSLVLFPNGGFCILGYRVP